VTYDATAGVVPDELKQSPIQKMTDMVSGILNGLALRVVVIFLVGALAVPFIADMLYPAFLNGTYNQIAINLADETKKHVPAQGKILQAINQYNLAWYYVTGSDNKVVPQTKAYVPELAGAPQNVGRNLEWKDKKYYEAVAAMGDGQLLHVGFYVGPVWGAALGMGGMGMAINAPLIFLVLVFGGVMCVTIALLQMFVSKPLGHLARACTTLLLARDAYSGVTGGGLDVSGSVTEVKKMAVGLKEIRIQYDEQVAARVSKEEELRKQRATYENEKRSLAKEYEDQLTQTQQKISELYTKEAEEEFINGLGREIDTLKSSHQVCQRILDKLNDKFPTSIIYGAFFKADKAQRFNLEAYLGFDDRSIQALKKTDHGKLAREVFTTGKYVTLGTEAIREHNLTPIAQAHGLKNIIYLPLMFQNRNLGMLGVYFNTEGQTVQERLRVLRNVVELASRSLYQVIIYEEELEAARTDPLTGLRNKKFFYEIMPQAFDRANLNPEQNPLSLIIMDGDHFKSINDTYGHQVGDQMLQDLAKTLRACVRVDDGEGGGRGGPGDYLIRYGGEEFLIVMENTDARRAKDVGERIRQAVENKTDWPGGIAKWTMSLGIATFPIDGRNADELLQKADTALYYVKEELGRNKTCHSQEVPKQFKSTKQAAVIGGELGVFDPAALLQSLATAQKTGILTVQARDGKQLWMLFEGGKPIQARLGKFAGSQAIVEFVTTFEEGNFNFQEKVMSGKETMTKLPKLDETFNVVKGLERCLMDGALAQDNYNAARTIISSPEMFIRPVPPVEFAARWQALGQLPEPPTPDEFNVMSEIVQRADGNTTLTNIFRGLDGIATATLWRASAMLVQHGLLQTKPAVPV
jgi:diguanylate cyclase (GGDEF)-like protein